MIYDEYFPLHNSLLLSFQPCFSFFPFEFYSLSHASSSFVFSFLFLYFSSRIHLVGTVLYFFLTIAGIFANVSNPNWILHFCYANIILTLCRRSCTALYSTLYIVHYALYSTLCIVHCTVDCIVRIDPCKIIMRVRVVPQLLQYTFLLQYTNTGTAYMAGGRAAYSLLQALDISSLPRLT